MLALGNIKEEVTIYDSRTWKPLNTIAFQHKKCELNDLAWDNTGTFLFIPNTAGTVYALDGKEPNLDSLIEIQAHFGTVFCLAIANSNDYFATGSADSNLLLWDMYELACLRSLGAEVSCL